MPQFLRASACVVLAAILTACQASGPRSDAADEEPVAPETLENGPSAAGLKSAVTFGRGLALRKRSESSTPFAADAQDPLRIHSLNIGAGSCHVIECPNSSDVMVYDCGQMRPTDTDLNAEAVKAYVDNIVESDDPVVVLSHADTDHVSLISKIMTGKRAQSVWFGGDPAEYKGSVATWLKSVDSKQLFFGWQPGWHERGRPVPELKCGDAETYLLTVNVGTSTNSKSLMLLLRYGSFSVAFSGDAEGGTESSALQNHGSLLQNVTVLMGSHHGARTLGSNGDDWASVTSPEIIIYSAGVSHGHPTATAAERYRAGLMETRAHSMWVSPEKPEEERYESLQAEYTTELSGIIVIETDGSSIDLSCSRQPDCF